MREWREHPANLPTIQEPFRRVAVNIVGPLQRTRIMTLCWCYLWIFVQMYPKAVPLRCTDASTLPMLCARFSQESAYRTKMLIFLCPPCYGSTTNETAENINLPPSYQCHVGAFSCHLESHAEEDGRRTDNVSAINMFCFSGFSTLLHRIFAFPATLWKGCSRTTVTSVWAADWADDSRITLLPWSTRSSWQSTWYYARHLTTHLP